MGEQLNGALSAYLKIYEAIEQDYLADIEKQGLDFAEISEQKLIQHPLAKWTNERKSCCYGWKSPACIDCRKGNESVSFYISLMCHRRCYYCFNPNQQEYEVFRQKKVDVVSRLDDYVMQGRKLKNIALTGGEPLLHKPETIEFFQAAKMNYPKAYLRLYTSGDLLDQEILPLLRDAGLNEIRFSIKLEDDAAKQEQVYDKIALAQQYIGVVMVEMPVIPGTSLAMYDVLTRLNRLGIAGINLLEFCFPFHNTEIFRQHGFKIKNPPFRVLYNYDYAAGLPIAGSEALCMELLDFAIKQKMSLGVHYCSLENKFTAQIFEQNYAYQHKVPWYFSPNDFFFKSIKVFGEAVGVMKNIFSLHGLNDYQINKKHACIEFAPRYLALLKQAQVDVQLGVAYYVVEKRNDEIYLRELHLEVENLAHIEISHL